MKTSKVLVIIGTRPEAIKLAPVISALAQYKTCHMQVCVTGQHQEMLAQMLDFFSIQPAFNLALMKPNQTLTSLTTDLIPRIAEVFQEFKPDWIIVQGDTSTAFICTLVAFYHQIKTAHVEAGLRTYDNYSPWPEEANRRLISALAEVHYAPTQENASNLIQERTPSDRILVTGNTVIDALLMVVQRIHQDKPLHEQLSRKFDYLDPKKRLILVTGHRRESHDSGLAEMCLALKKISEREDVEIVYPVHLNPKVQKAVYEVLSGANRVHLIAPQDYVPFIYLLQRCELVITDSGGIQEEAPSLGKPVIVTRPHTERQEGVTAGTAVLAGTNLETIVSLTHELLNDPVKYDRMSRAHNPYGDGKASERIAKDLFERCFTKQTELV